MKIDKSIRNQIIAGVAVLAIAGLASWFFGFLSIPITYIGGIIRRGVSFFGDTVLMPRWFYYLLVLFGLALLGLALLTRIKEREEDISFRKYQRDTFFGVVWRWSYSSSGDFYGDSLAPYCPSDDTLLVNKPHSFDYENAELFCETCRKDFTPREGELEELKGKVIRQIDCKLRTGEWQKVVKDHTSKV